MSSEDISPISVVKYNKDYLIELVRYFTGWTQRSEVSIKPQLNYLCNYLEVDHIAAKTIVVENEYIDRHYLEDYSEYYARCFASHPRKCVRVHFFSNEFDELTFTSSYVENKYKFFSELNKHYIGFAVIRPIPHTFFAKVCLKPYGQFTDHPDYKLITKQNSVSLFGVNLNIKTTAFLEQDKVVSACATSALWTLLGASSTTHQDSLPSPSSITKAAASFSQDGTRTFPNTGLTHTQVSRTLKHYDLEPSVIEIAGKNYDDLNETIYAYISNDIPVLIGGDIYKKTNEGKSRPLGKHLVCALGYHLSNENKKPGKFQQFRSHEIDKIYAHDDRYGPYVKISSEVKKFTATKPGTDRNETKYGLEISLLNENNEIFVPEILIVGLYHKIRIPYKNIKEMCQALFEYLCQSKQFLMQQSKTLQDKEEKEYYKEVVESIEKGITSVWDIRLITSNSIKEELLKKDNFQTYNGTSNKKSLLMGSMPKYIWRCRLLEFESRSEYTDILFDATEVPQGKVLIGYISYSLNAETMWKYVESLVKDRVWESFELNDDLKKFIGGFSKFFSENEKTTLNILYGPLGLPRRKLKSGETDAYGNIPRGKDVSVVRSGQWDWKKLDQKTKYIWVINEFGDLVFGEDLENDVDGFLGHPTLIDGKPARIGGELVYSSKNKRWEINLKSGTYSSHIAPDSTEAKHYLSNVIKHNFIGLKGLKIMPAEKLIVTAA
ncbi:hypothetical protein INP77_07755 [Methylophilus sp. 13]|uniref:hypothetical protein n=1 Tax=Methylophilus sp. 13 TaxID=2781018 RepID=UPI00188FD639|nr:hypothetical protein [Methylophilus sp. 13]MBF5039382.1 hypothetical protein [Methylophilus sp. 13]